MLGWLAGWIPARPNTKELARSRTMALSHSSNSCFTAPALADAIASERMTFCRMNSAMCGLFRARLRLSRASPTFSAAVAMLLQSPDTMASIAALTLRDIRLMGAASVPDGAGGGLSSTASVRLAGVPGGVMFSMIGTVGGGVVGRNALNVTFYVSPNLIEWFWNQILMYTFKHFLGTNAHLLLSACRRRSAMFGRKTKFQSEKLMADVYLGIMIAGVNALIVLGVVLAFVVV
jgi:hypothetical protein